MPQLTRVLAEEDVRRRQPGRNIDFTPYMELLDTVQAQGGGRRSGLPGRR